MALRSFFVGVWIAGAAICSQFLATAADSEHDATAWDEQLVAALNLKIELLEDKPLQLVRPGQGHDKLEVNEMVVEQLATLAEPVAILAVVGPYHGGKSFLLNVLLNSSRGFIVGTKPEPETRGIWIRVLPRHRITGIDGSRVILMDTEGFYGEAATRLFDARIFAVATLLSSHLIYNTIRTLGDAHSVSALADLAKQAQVFNLQNWLHSGDVKADWTNSSDVDPSLLLKTLEFPPLTWVVQGFDIDLLASENPMDHLQRYLLAHARTGDQTFDTLFTKGISCYTLRTPADLNFVRERFHGKGLAADEELYTTLHPGYLSDVQKLQTAVFGNLTAKGDGKFTGRTIAALLPLLIHYVNEDFPLHADRKLRDVLLGIIVDGGFAGGVEYFQKCMQDKDMKDAVIATKRGNKFKGNVQPTEAMSTLAASALTLEELELLMASAEHQAIEYCKRRSVGVPQSLVATTCQGQLAVKINRMKPAFREENEHRVKEVLILLGEDLRSTAEKRVLGLQLPMQETDLQHHCNQAIKHALQGYENLVGPHKGSVLYKEASSQMKEEIQLKCDRVSRINTEKISAIFNAAKNIFRNAYESTFLSQSFMVEDSGQEHDSTISVEETLVKNKRPLSKYRLNEIHSNSLQGAQVAFDKGVVEGLPWMRPGKELYDFYHFQCMQWSKQRFVEIQAHNDVLIAAFCQNISNDLIARFKEEASKIIPFPDNDEIISEKADNIAKLLLQDFLSLTKEYSSSLAVEERRKELIRSMEETRAHILKKNTALMAAFCYDPLMEAYRELNMQDCERTFHNMWVSWLFWSRKCLWPGPRALFGFKYAAYTAARKHLDKAQSSVVDSVSASPNHDIARGVVLSLATRNKVIQAWIEHDLAHHANVVLVNFILVISCIAVSFSVFLWIGKRLVTSLKNTVNFQADEVGAMPCYNGKTYEQDYYKARPAFYKKHQ